MAAPTTQAQSSQAQLPQLGMTQARAEKCRQGVLNLIVSNPTARSYSADCLQTFSDPKWKEGVDRLTRQDLKALSEYIEADRDEKKRPCRHALVALSNPGHGDTCELMENSLCEEMPGFTKMKRLYTEKCQAKLQESQSLLGAFRQAYAQTSQGLQSTRAYLARASPSSPSDIPYRMVRKAGHASGLIHHHSLSLALAAQNLVARTFLGSGAQAFLARATGPGEESFYLGQDIGDDPTFAWICHNLYMILTLYNTNDGEAATKLVAEFEGQTREWARKGGPPRKAVLSGFLFGLVVMAKSDRTEADSLLAKKLYCLLLTLFSNEEMVDELALSLCHATHVQDTDSPRVIAQALLKATPMLAAFFEVDCEDARVKEYAKQLGTYVGSLNNISILASLGADVLHTLLPEQSWKRLGFRFVRDTAGLVAVLNNPTYKVAPFLEFLYKAVSFNMERSATFPATFYNAVLRIASLIWLEQTLTSGNSFAILLCFVMNSHFIGPLFVLICAIAAFIADLPVIRRRHEFMKTLQGLRNAPEEVRSIVARATGDFRAEVRRAFRGIEDLELRAQVNAATDLGVLEVVDDP